MSSVFSKHCRTYLTLLFNNSFRNYLRTCSSYKNSGHTMSSTQHGLTEWSLWLRHSSLLWPLLLYRVHNSILLLDLQDRTSFMACPILNSFRILSSEIFWLNVIFNIFPTSSINTNFMPFTICRLHMRIFYQAPTQICQSHIRPDACIAPTQNMSSTYNAGKLT